MKRIRNPSLESRRIEDRVVRGTPEWGYGRFIRLAWRMIYWQEAKFRDISLRLVLKRGKS